MMCHKPMRRFGQGTSNLKQLPCGKCIGCRKARINEWCTRLQHELEYHKDSCFITLTYSDKWLPLCKSICKQILQRFLKRLRKELGDTKIRYFACGEYGKREDRPHYHLVVFGFVPCLDDLYVACIKEGRKYYGSRTILRLWPYGFNTVGTVSPASIRYICKYVQKVFFGELAEKVYAGRLPPFALQSKGIGRTYCIQNRDRLQEDLSIAIGHSRVNIPRYYSRLLGIPNERFSEARAIKEAQKMETFINEGHELDDYYDHAEKSNEQAIKNTIALEKIKEI